MKKLLFFLLIAFVGYFVYQKDQAHKREMLVGAWSMERSFEGGSARLIMNLKPGGDATVEVDATVRGRSGSKDASGRWEVKNSALAVTFSRTDIAAFKLGKNYGGRILTLDEKTLSYRSEQGVETWSRLR